MTDICQGSEALFFKTKNCNSLHHYQFPTILIYPNLSYVNNSPDLFDICLLKWNNEGLLFELKGSFVINFSQNGIESIRKMDKREDK